jgi:D-amino peptidase
MGQQKRIYIMVDFEGGSCIVGTPGKPFGSHAEQYQLSRRVMTREANAAAAGAFDGGATEVIVNDAHGGGLNLLYEELDSRVGILLGSPRPVRFPAMDDSYAGLFLIGYHAMSGTADGVLAHTYSSTTVHRVWVNGREYGEVGMDSAYAGTLMGVPTIFVSGDDKVAAEAQDVLGDVETVATKQGFGRNCALSLSPEESCRRIREGAAAAVRRSDDFKPLVWEGPLDVRRVFKHENLAEDAARQPDSERIDAYTVTQRQNSVADLLR